MKNVEKGKSDPRFDAKEPQVGGTDDPREVRFEPPLPATFPRLSLPARLPFFRLPHPRLVTSRYEPPMPAPTSTVFTADPIGVAAAVQAQEDPAFVLRPKIFEEFSLAGRVCAVSETSTILVGNS